MLKDYAGEAIRYVLLAAHYRAPLDWSDDVIEQAKNSLDRLYGALRKLADVEIDETSTPEVPDAFLAALHDDLNTPRALAELFALAKQANTAESPTEKQRLKQAMLAAGDYLGLLQQDPEAWFAGKTSDVDAQYIDALVAERAQAKADKNWARADEIRDELSQRNVVLEDGPDGTIWRVED